MSYKLVLEALRGHESQSLADDVSTWLPNAIFQGYLAQRGVTGFRHATPQAAYWDGKSFDLRPWPTEQAAWVEDYGALADKVIAQASDGTTIIDIGSGLSAPALFIALRGRQKGLTGLKFVNIDMDPDAIQIGDEMARRHGIDMRNFCLDFARAVQSGKIDLELFPGPRIIVSRGGIYPWYDRAQLPALFDFLIHKIGAQAGVHWEVTGFRTEKYREIIKTLPGALPPSRFLDETPDPMEYLASNADRLGIEVTEHMDLWPHYQGLRMPGLVHWPTYLAWRKQGP